MKEWFGSLLDLASSSVKGDAYFLMSNCMICLDSKVREIAILGMRRLPHNNAWMAKMSHNYGGPPVYILLFLSQRGKEEFRFTSSRRRHAPRGIRNVHLKIALNEHNCLQNKLQIQKKQDNPSILPKKVA